MTDHTGACFCGHVRYRLTRDPMIVHACHCTDCQKQTGGAFAINAVIERSAVALEAGEPQRFTLSTESGRPHDVWRCPQCLGALWSDYGRRETIIFVRVTTLDAPQLCPPDVHIYTRSKLPWFELSGDVPAFEAYYSLAEVWPVESQQRRRAASGAA